jgi:hypothetical protein
MKYGTKPKLMAPFLTLHGFSPLSANTAILTYLSFTLSPLCVAGRD